MTSQASRAPGAQRVAPRAQGDEAWHTARWGLYWWANHWALQIPRVSSPRKLTLMCSNFECVLIPPNRLSFGSVRKNIGKSLKPMLNPWEKGSHSMHQHRSPVAMSIIFRVGTTMAQIHKVWDSTWNSKLFMVSNFNHFNGSSLTTHDLEETCWTQKCSRRLNTDTDCNRISYTRVQYSKSR